MRFLTRTSYWWALLAGVALLTFLGILQYHWIERAGEAELQERRQFLRTALGGVRRDVVERLRAPLTAFRLEPPNRRAALDEATIASDFRLWLSEHGDNRLLVAVALGRKGKDGRASYFRMGADDDRMREAEWPQALRHYQAFLEAPAESPPGEPRFFRGMPPWVDDGRTLRFVFRLIDTMPPPDAVPMVRRRPFAGMTTDVPPLPNAPARQMQREAEGWCFLEFDEQAVAELLPGLVLRYFGESGIRTYRVALVGGPDHTELYSSSPPLTGAGAIGPVDEEIPLFAPLRPGGEGRAREDLGFGLFNLPPASPGESRARVPQLMPSWSLTARHFAGSLTRAVRQNRLRTLFLSFAVMMLLLGSGVLLVLSTHRANRLAKQQMEFVAGVSHELRTPLAVILTTSHNLAHGKVSDPQHLRRYGETMQDAARRLSTRVEQMLSFAGILSGRKLYDLRSVDAETAVEQVLSELAPAFESAGWQIDRQFETGLPAASADPQVLETCLRNVLENGFKYAASGRWIGVAARSVVGPGGPEIQISVSDRGPGIDPDDLAHIFEPFYRGGASTNSAAPGGVGLGLSLVRRLMDATRGRVTVKTSRGHGTTFTLHLPAACRS